MHKIGWTVVVLLACMMNGIAQSDVSAARWKTNEIVIDGNLREWTKPLNFYDDASGVLFAICNDEQAVYLAFSCNDRFKMRKMMSSGWSVELSSKEKDRKFNATITFPGVPMEINEKYNPGSQFEKKAPGNPVIKAYQSKLTLLPIKGFLTVATDIKINDPTGIDISIGADSAQSLVYEMAIPLNALMNEKTIQLNELITLSVSVNAFQKYSSGSADRGGRSGRGGGMEGGGRMGGGRRGGMEGGGRPGGMPGSEGGYRAGGYGDNSGLADKASFKQKFTLVRRNL